MEVKDLNLRQKLAKIRLEFVNSNIKKSGVNNFAGFKYFELCDIVPKALELFEKYDVSLDFRMAETTIEGALYDNSKPEIEPIKFSFLRKEYVPTKGMNNIQALGSEITYYRRYLYNIVLDIVENDVIDSLDNTDKTKTKTSQNKAKTTPNKPANNQAVSEQYITKEQTEAVKKAVKNLIEKDPRYKSKMAVIEGETFGFTNMTVKSYKDTMTRIDKILNCNENPST